MFLARMGKAGWLVPRVLPLNKRYIPITLLLQQNRALLCQQLIEPLQMNNEHMQIAWQILTEAEGEKKKKAFFWYAIITVKQWKILVGLLYVSD